jgi:hypothetical protein
VRTARAASPSSSDPGKVTIPILMRLTTSFGAPAGS